MLLRGLVERFPDSDRPNAFLYRPTFEAWRYLGMKGKEDLPDFEKYQELLKKFEMQTETSTEGGGEQYVDSGITGSVRPGTQ